MTETHICCSAFSFDLLTLPRAKERGKSQPLNWSFSEVSLSLSRAFSLSLSLMEIYVYKLQRHLQSSSTTESTCIFSGTVRGWTQCRVEQNIHITNRDQGTGDVEADCFRWWISSGLTEANYSEKYYRNSSVLVNPAYTPQSNSQPSSGINKLLLEDWVVIVQILCPQAASRHTNQVLISHYYLLIF